MIKQHIEIEGNTLPFLANDTLTKGLLYTDQFEHVVQNIDTFSIEFDESLAKSETISNVSKRGDYAIITLKFDAKHQSQYLISNALDLDKMNKLSDQVISQPFKKLIANAYTMTQSKRTLGDFFKK